MSWICQSTTSGRGAAPSGLANPEEINQNKFNNAIVHCKINLER